MHGELTKINNAVILAKHNRGTSNGVNDIIKQLAIVLEGTTLSNKAAYGINSVKQ